MEIQSLQILLKQEKDCSNKIQEELMEVNTEK